MQRAVAIWTHYVEDELNQDAKLVVDRVLFVGERESPPRTSGRITLNAVRDAEDLDVSPEDSLFIPPSGQLASRALAKRSEPSLEPFTDSR